MNNETKKATISVDALAKLRILLSSRIDADSDDPRLVRSSDKNAADRALLQEIDTAIEEADMLVIDLKHSAYDALADAAAQSPWIPPEYMSNDWIADCCAFLRGEGPRFLFTDAELCDMFKRRVRVEQALFDMANGKRPMPTAQELRTLGLDLGVASKPEEAVRQFLALLDAEAQIGIPALRTE